MATKKSMAENAVLKAFLNYEPADDPVYVATSGQLLILDGAFDLELITRATIAELRNPTPEMIEAMRQDLGLQQIPENRRRIADAFQAAIDAALKETE